MAFFNGYSGDVTISSTAYHVSKWSGDIEGEILDTTSTGDAGWKTNIVGPKSGTISVESYYDPTVNPTGATLNINPGVLLTATLNIGSTGKTITGTFRVSKVHFENAVNGVIPFNFDATSSGVVTLPT